MRLKTYEEDERLAVAEPIRSGNIELRVTEVVIRELSTVLGNSGWRTYIRGDVVSSERLPYDRIKTAFTVTGEDREVHEGVFRRKGEAWRESEGVHFLPPNVPGALEIYSETRAVSFTFFRVAVSLNR